jgi:hypothetical protein
MRNWAFRRMIPDVSNLMELATLNQDAFAGERAHRGVQRSGSSSTDRRGTSKSTIPMRDVVQQML